MIKYFSTIIIMLILGLTSVNANAGSFLDKGCLKYKICNNHHERSVPELSAAVAPVAVAMILGIAGIGLERRRRNNKK